MRLNTIAPAQEKPVRLPLYDQKHLAWPVDAVSAVLANLHPAPAILTGDDVEKV